MGLCYRFECWDEAARDFSLSLVLCYRCQHSPAWGLDPAKHPRKLQGPGRRKDDPRVELPPVALPCEWCEANGWEPDFEDDEMERRCQERVRSAPPPQSPAPAWRAEETGQVSMF